MADGPWIIVVVRHPAASSIHKSVIFETYNHTEIHGGGIWKREESENDF